MAINFGDNPKGKKQDKTPVQPQQGDGVSWRRIGQELITMFNIAMACVLIWTAIVKSRETTRHTIASLSPVVEGLNQISGSLVAMHEILDQNGIITSQNPVNPVKFLILRSKDGKCSMYESKGGVISEVPSSRYMILDVGSLFEGDKYERSKGK